MGFGDLAKSFAAFCILVFGMQLVGCGEDMPVDDEEDTEVEETNTPPQYIHDTRPARLHVPRDYDENKSYPLVVMIHGFSVSGALQDVIFQLVKRVNSHQFVLIVPEGTKNRDKNGFWNAFSDCCNFYDENVDDVAYISSLIEEAFEHVNIDRSRVTSLGQSNGGYMSYRMACERPDLVRRVVSVAGSMPVDREECVASDAVTVLQVHGTEDPTVPYDNNLDTEGGEGHGIYTRGAEATVADWLEINDCAEEASENYRADFFVIEGDETEVTRWECRAGTSVEFWRVEGGEHLLGSRNSTFQNRIAEFVTAE